MVFRADTKKVSGTDDISQGLYLSKLKKTTFMETRDLLIIKGQSPISLKTPQNLRKMALL